MNGQRPRYYLILMGEYGEVRKVEGPFHTTGDAWKAYIDRGYRRMLTPYKIVAKGR